MQLLAPLALALSALALNAHASHDANGNNVAFRNNRVSRERTLGGLLGLVKRQICDTGKVVCPDSPGSCCPTDTTCCGRTGCCPETEYCSTVNGYAACCPNGQTCLDTSVGSSSSTSSASITTAVDVPIFTSTSDTSLSTTNSSSSTTLGGSTSTSTSTTSSLSSSVNSPVRPSPNNAGSSSTRAASPSGQTTGGSGNSNPFDSSGAFSTTTSLGILTSCGSALASLLAAVLL